MTATEAPALRVVIADDQPVVLHGFAAILDSAPDLSVVGTAPDGVALLELVKETAPDLAVVDVRMPHLDEYVYDALQAGASGFLLKDVTASNLVEGVRLVADGSMLLGPSVTRRLVGDFAARGPGTSSYPGIDQLTARETEVLLAVARGLSNAEIAASLHIGDQTVKSHVSEALRKLECRDRVQLVIAAYESGLVG